MSRLRLALLGSPAIDVADRRVTLPTRKALALLAYLATERGTQSREKLTALLWPESDAEHGRATLRRTLALLREALERPDQPTPLTASRATVGLDHTLLDLDLAVLQHAAEARDDAPALWREAVAAYRGDFLDGFSLSDAPEFDDWASAQREHRHRQFGTILDRLARWQADHGEVAGTIETATRWVAHDPLNEAAHRRLIEARFASGERAAALEAYAACQALLARELGTEPSPETSALAARIRAAAPPQPRARAIRQATSQLPEPPLLGRAEEFAALIARYEALRAGQAGLAVIIGEAGIGKTRLADEFLARATALGATTLRGRAFETDRQLPYQPLIDAIRPQLSRHDDPRTLLPAIWLAELSRLFPELRERLPDLAAPTADESAARTRLFAAMARLGQALAQAGPLVLAIDDLQWADDASLDLLGYLGRRWADEGTPILLLLTVRSEALHHQADQRTPSLSEWLGGLERAMPATRLTLDSLTPAATGGIAAAVLTGAAEAGEVGTWLHQETGGQPFYIAETLKSLVERGVIVAEAGGWALRAAAWRRAESAGAILPPGVREVIRARVARLGREAQLLLAAGAVLGHGFGFAQLCRVADLGEDAALDALDQTLAGHLLREEGATAPTASPTTRFAMLSTPRRATPGGASTTAGRWRPWQARGPRRPNSRATPWLRTCPNRPRAIASPPGRPPCSSSRCATPSPTSSGRASRSTRYLQARRHPIYANSSPCRPVAPTS
ncbi:MAG: AAA family ATPase [Thermomicrobiales bacterium]